MTLENYIKEKSKKSNTITETIGVFSILSDWKIFEIELIKNKINWIILTNIKKVNK